MFFTEQMRRGSGGDLPENRVVADIGKLKSSGNPSTQLPDQPPDHSLGQGAPFGSLPIPKFSLERQSILTHLDALREVFENGSVTSLFNGSA